MLCFFIVYFVYADEIIFYNGYAQFDTVLFERAEDALMQLYHPNKIYPAYIFDLDGTVLLGDNLLPTSGDTIHELHSAGARVVYLSNNPTHSPGDYASKLSALGVACEPADVINSTVVMVNFLKREMPGARLFVLGEAPLLTSLEEAGFTLADHHNQVDAVIASFDRTFVYKKLQIAFDAIRAGARFFATNRDRFCPVPGGGEPDAAAIIAAIEACTDKKVEAVVGKPSFFTIQAILDLVELPADQCLLTGDRLETDIVMGQKAGMDTALTLTGVAQINDLQSLNIRPTYVIENLAQLLPK